MMVIKHKLKPWVYNKIIDLIDLNSELAKEQGVTIESIEITEELYRKIINYLLKNNLITHMRHGKGGRWGGGSGYEYCYNFVLVTYYKSNKLKYYLNNGGALGCDVSRKNNEQKNGKLEERTPTTIKLFYGILRKYPDHILNVDWRYMTDMNDMPF